MQTTLGHLKASKLGFRTTGRKPLVADVDLDVAPGQGLAIVGPNGAGKTTLLRMLFGRLQPSAGSVALDGIPLGRIPADARARKMAVVTQDEQPDQRLTTGDYVALGRIPHHGRHDRATHRQVVANALEATGIGALAGRTLGALSGGEQQRARIARAIAQSPCILLLDEPTNHLDLRGRADLLSLVRGLGITVVAVLHDLALVSVFADQVAVLQAGRIVSRGPPGTALAAGTVRDVFGMDCFAVTNPLNGRPMMVFDAPTPSWPTGSGGP